MWIEWSYTLLSTSEALCGPIQRWSHQQKDCRCCRVSPLLLGLFYCCQVFLAFLLSRVAPRMLSKGRTTAQPRLQMTQRRELQTSLVPAQLIVPLLIIKPVCELIWGLFWREPTLKEANSPEPSHCAPRRRRHVCFCFEALLCLLGKFRNNWVHQSQSRCKSTGLFDEKEFLLW